MLCVVIKFRSLPPFYTGCVLLSAYTPAVCMYMYIIRKSVKAGKVVLNGVHVPTLFTQWPHDDVSKITFIKGTQPSLLMDDSERRSHALSPGDANSSLGTA